MDDAARTQLVGRHRETLLGVVELGRAVTNEWQTDRVTDPEEITEPLERLVDASNLGPSLLELLVDASQTIGGRLDGRPVPAPPYLLLTSRGPLCRGTLGDGRRVVVTLDLFEVKRNPPAYVFLDPTPEECLDVAVEG